MNPQGKDKIRVAVVQNWKEGLRKLHGLSKSKEYRLWTGMKSRCYNPLHDSYPYYGGRGITVSPLWLHDFPQFLKDVGPRPSPKYSLDRVNNDGNYEPGNVQWELKSIQNSNKRRYALCRKLRDFTDKELLKELERRGIADP